MEITRSEIIEWMFEDAPASCNYWIRGGTFAMSKGIFKITETVDNWAEVHGPIIITPDDLEKAIDQWCTQHAKGHGYDYFDRFAKDWLWGDYAAADYDAEVVDQIVQWAAFGEIRYG